MLYICIYPYTQYTDIYKPHMSHKTHMSPFKIRTIRNITYF